jgi:beta-aspartyl-peptidase (threonine type)
VQGTYFGTVGAVALDAHGHVAAGTSTGGMTNKRYSRVGDSPIIGAGTYADERCGVSGTGWGEFYLRAVVASDICARVAYRGDTLAAAAEEVVNGVVPRLGGDGGAIALDVHGNIAMPFNTPGMYRGWIHPDGSRGTAIFPVGE